MPGKRRPYPAYTFWLKIDIRSDDECWPWLAGKNRAGYGIFCEHLSDRSRLAHRRMLEDTIGRRLKRDEFACHSCDNPACMNPAHLWVGSDLENIADMVGKRRHKRHSQFHCAKGHPFSGDNLVIRSDKYKGRACRECRRAALRAFKARRRAKAQELSTQVQSSQGMAT